MNDGDDIDTVLAIDRETARLESRRLAAVYRLVREARETVGHQYAERSVCEELRLARRVHRGECVTVVTLAVALHEQYPGLLGLLREGLLDQYRAEQACEVLRTLTGEQAEETVERIATRLHETGRPYDWRSYLRRVADTVAPEAKQHRMSARRRDLWVRIEPGPDGAGTLLAQLPNEILAATAARLETTARTLRAHSDPRNLEQLRADVLTHLLTDNHPGSMDPDNSEDPDNGDSASGEEGGDKPAQVGPIRETRTLVNIHVKLGTILHLDNHTATVEGYGPIPAHTARELLTNPDHIIRKILTDPDTGTVTGLGRRHYRPTRRQRDYIHARDGHCRTPGCTRPIAEIDHTHEWQHGGATNTQNLQGLCRLHHTLKTLPNWHHTRNPTTGSTTITTPTGHTHHPDPDPPPF